MKKFQPSCFYCNTQSNSKQPQKSSQKTTTLNAIMELLPKLNISKLFDNQQEQKISPKATQPSTPSSFLKNKTAQTLENNRATTLSLYNKKWLSKVILFVFVNFFVFTNSCLHKQAIFDKCIVPKNQSA